jgi:chemotaxis protein methyltransferase CheR
MQNPAFPDDVYVRFRDLLLQRCGLDFSESRRADLLHCLTLSLRELGFADFAQLYAQAVSDERIWEALIRHVTVGETYFFRNTPQFTALREWILPEIFARQLGGARCWSAGCATGEEPYSLAITISELLGAQAASLVNILATDINTEFLARAQNAVYGSWSFRETSPALKSRYFTADGDRWQLQANIRRMVRFARLNLAEKSYPAIANGTCALDLILCRNVTIYFDAATTRQVVTQLYHALAPGGWLVVGHAEPQLSLFQQFEVHNFPGTVVYRKSLNAPFFALDDRSDPASIAAIAPPIAALKPIRSYPVPQQYAETPSAGAPQPTSQDLLRVARESADRGEWQAARQQCGQVLALDPLCRDAHYLMAQIHEQHNEFEAALSAYRRAVYLDRSFVPGLIGMATVWQALGCNADAQRAYRSALKQLDRLSPGADVPHSDGLTFADLRSFVLRQLQLLS